MTATKKFDTRNEQVEAEIRGWILTNRYAYGSWLPSIQKLCQELSVSDKTVKRALGRLKKEGLVKGINGRGLLVKRRQKHVLLLSYRGVRPDWTYMNEHEGLLRRAVEGWHERISVLGRDCDRPVGIDVERHRAEIEAADAIATYSIQDDDFHLALSQCKRPVLAIDFCPKRAAVDAVSFASYQAGYRAARHFLDLGHRRMAFLGVTREVVVREPQRHKACLPESDTELAVGGFQHALYDAGLAAEPGQIAKSEAADAGETLKRLLSRRPAPTALVSWHDLRRFDVGAHVRALGLRVPQDLSFCQVCSGSERSRGCTAVRYDLAQVLDLAVERLKHLLEGPPSPPRLSQIVPGFEMGNSSAPPAPA